MNYNFCTFLDKKYLIHGLALYNSLCRFCPNFKIWVMCLDDESYDLLEKINLDNMLLVSMTELEDSELLAVKNEASRFYLGTLKPPFIKYVLDKNPEIDMVVYLDADVYLFSSPIKFYENFRQNASFNILITPHRFPEKREQLERKVGIFNNGIMCFKNNSIGLACLQEWREDCIKHCENRFSDGFYSNQKYLDKWPREFSGVCVSEDKGVNLAPFNVSQYKIIKSEKSLYIDSDLLIFYHFSSLRIYSPKDFLLFDYAYKLNRRVRNLIYRPYTKELREIIAKLNILEPTFIPSFQVKPNMWEYLRYKTMYNVVKIHIYLKEKVPLYSNIFHKYFHKKEVLRNRAPIT